MSTDRFVRRSSSKSRSGSGEYQSCKKNSSSVSQSEATGFKVEDTNTYTSGSEKNGKHVKSDSRDSDFDHDPQLRRGSLSFPVKRSGLSNKLPHPAHFERSNSDDHNKILSETHDIKSESPHSTTTNKLSSSKESKSNPTTKRKNDRYQDTCSKDDSVNSKEARSKLSSSDSNKRGRERNSNRQRPSNRRRKSASSRASDGSRGTHRAKSTADGISPDHKRSLSRGSSSYHSSMSRSHYSSRTESSHKYDRRKRSYLKSKTYSSRSSARTSRSYRSSYSSRSRSSSARTPRCRRHVRSFYRRRHRHRSYSVRSRSRSRSWHSTDSSFSSQSSRSSRSRYFSRRNVSKKRSSSRRSRTPLYRPTSSFKKVSDDYVRSTPERRLARLGVGPVNKDSNLDDKTNSPYGDSKPMSYMPSVNETVSAAVKRVVGGGQSKNQKASNESTISKNNNCTTESNSANNSKSADECNSDSRSQPLSSSDATESNDKTSSPPVLVDIPLPQDALHQSSDNSNNNNNNSSNNSNKPATYIGPQVPPDLAKRFGLSVADTSVKSETTDSIATVPSSRNTTVVTSESSQLQNTSSSSCDTVSSSATKNTDTEVTSSNPPEFTIPPEQAELYRPLQEQAKEHALRRSGMLITPLLSSIPSSNVVAAGNVSITDPSMPQQVSADAILLRQQQQQQLSALCGAAYQQQANSNDPTQLFVGSVGGNPHITSSLTVEQPATSISFPTSIRQDVNSISASIQQAQLQQLFAAAALQSATQGNNNNSVLPSQATVAQQQLLNQLIAQQSQISGLNIAPNLVTASLLAAQQQQKQLIAQWQKRALALAAASAANDQLKNAQDKRLSAVNPGTNVTNPAVVTPTSLASVLNAGNSLPAAIQLGLLRSSLNAQALSTNSGLNTPNQNQVAAVAALIAAAQQQQQLQQQLQQQQQQQLQQQQHQQQPATAQQQLQQQQNQQHYQQATIVSSAPQFPVSSANQELANAVQSALLPQQLQQRLLSLQASLIQQKQQQQQQQQQQIASMNNAAATAAVAASGNAALLQAVIASSQQQQLQQQQQQLQQRQQQIAHSQFQQQQQAALAAILAAQRQQQQQQQSVQDRSNKPL
ncbi:unnamed protein product [Trichobilharzia szidati]|nr:unnamed protein product [Trichobilharzia szidati]